MKPIEAACAAEIDGRVWQAMAHLYGTKESVPMLPFAGAIGRETRRLYFGAAVEHGGLLRTEPMLVGGAQTLRINRIISFGDCNMQCPYCKRDCQFVGDDGLPMVAVQTPLVDVLRLAVYAHSRGETVRFSGGDPVVFKAETRAIATYMHRVHGAKCSIAHNGTWGRSIAEIAPYLETAAIDLKGLPDEIGNIYGVPAAAGPDLFRQALKTISTLSSAGGVLLDIRTPVFRHTTQERMIELAGQLPTGAFWTWRVYKEVDGCSWKEPSVDEVLSMMEAVSLRFPRQWMGLRAKWEAGGMVYFREGKQVECAKAQVSVGGGEEPAGLV